MTSDRPAVRSIVVFFALFCGVQALFLYWWMQDPSFVPDLAEAERLLQLQEYSPAVHHLKPLAAAGSTRAECLLGELYVNGEGVGKNIPEGVRYLEKAADGGALQAQYLLSRLYSNGEGVPKDLVRAHFWLSVAAQEQSDARGLLLMLERTMTREQIDRAWAMAEQRAPGARERIDRQ